MKRKGIFLFFISFSISFVLLTSVFVMTTGAYFGGEWIAHVFSAELYSISLLLYFFSFSVGIGLFYSFWVLYTQNGELSTLEEYLNYLAKGQYAEKLFVPLKQENELVSIEYREIRRLILAIRESLVDLSKEALGTFEKDNGMSLEAREQIVEEERHRIARELHDSVSQQLFAAMMMLSAINQHVLNLKMDEAVTKQLGLIEKIINEAQSEMRALLLHLRPIKLEGKTLKQGIELLLEELKTKTTIQLTWNVQDLYLNSTIEDHLFRIIQEVLSNTLRHAKAEHVEVYVTKNQEFILVKIIDDGIGFDTSIKKPGNYGLRNIRERILSMGGVIHILSFPEKGTRVEIKIPVTKGGTANDSAFVSG